MRIFFCKSNPVINLIIGLLWAIWVGWIFSTVGAFGGIMAGVGHITIFGLGDYAKNMAKRTGVLAQMHPIDGAGGAIRRMARQVELMLKDALDAYIQRDEALARDVIERDVDIDQMYNTLFREFLTFMLEDPRNITACMHLHFIAKNIERMGDHATTIAEQVIYLVTGSLPDDARPKGDRTAHQGIDGI